MKSPIIIQILPALVFFAFFNGSFAQGPDWAFEYSKFRIYEMSRDDDQNLYLNGRLIEYDSDDLDPGPGEQLVSGPADLIVKLDSNGQFKWARELNQSGLLYVSEDALFLNGIFFETTDFDPGPGVYNLSPGGISGMFIQQLDHDGNFVQVISFDQSEVSGIADLTVDNNKNIYIAGDFNGTIDADPGPGIVELYTPVGINSSLDGFVIKLDSEGTYQWSRQLFTNDDGAVNMHSLELDDYGHLYVAGWYTDTLDFGAGDSLLANNGASYFMLKTDTLNNFEFARSIGESMIQRNAEMISDSHGNIYIGDDFWSSNDFDPGPLNDNLYPFGDHDFFIEKFDSSGNKIWLKHWGGIYNDHLVAMRLDDQDNLYIAADFSGTCDVNGASGILEANSYGHPEVVTPFDPSPDFFIQKINPTGDIVWTGQAGNFYHDAIYGLEVNNNTLYITGVSSGTIDLRPGDDTLLLNGPGVYDLYYFMARLAQPFEGLTDLYIEQPFSESTIFPNPTTGEFNVFVYPVLDWYTIQLFDCTGQLVFDSWILESAEFDISLLPQGVYFCKIFSEEQELITKLVKVD